MASANDRLVWIDCEMTGLDLAVDELVEVAIVITDFDLKPVDPGFDVVIRPSAEAVAQMNEFVTAMHAASGLTEAMADGVTLAQAGEQALDYVRRFTQPGQSPIAGNTIGTDRAFIAKYLPELDAHLHYRSVDVSSIKELAKRWYPRVYFNAPAKHGGHRALADILESIRELEYYRRALLVPEPGPTSEEAQSAASAAVESFAPLIAAG